MRLFKKIYQFLFHPSIKSVRLARLTVKAHAKNYIIISNMFRNRLLHKYGIHIGKKTQLGENLKFPHPNGIIIGDDVVIGSNCTIYHQVTLGKKNGSLDYEKDYPVIGNNVTIFPGAKIIGKITIEDNVTVAANSVVLADVEANSVCAGIPAKVIKKK
ncbi:serine acetyltransferase [Gracilibacillus caseinilyticus]|uniref:Serine acetyltransferase n=1 Tax=Gracilibacillus caseinilyticus TaxID=2932256 RepID=A0ABY4F1H1_9BACI|nr:serine acetyltransferase [Gracilibacillus caseinilyticus]UOQ50329.1 serine acetyltransferase [Gracilibacillus caseinilyticus]